MTASLPFIGMQINSLCMTNYRNPSGVLQISSDGDDQRFFGGLKFLLPGYFWVGKFGKYFFVWPDLSRDFFCI